ncbi:hypothetical protein [Flagellimonas sp.]|uniref:hypothetical protein n=1 Tax=Flagellimonas sp. TaxID=2058762 RepID=UPI003B50BDBC
MKTVLLLITVIFSSLVFLSCTNEEGENDLDFISPNEEEEGVVSAAENRDTA